MRMTQVKDINIRYIEIFCSCYVHGDGCAITDMRAKGFVENIEKKRS